MVLKFSDPTTEDIEYLIKHLSVEDEREILCQGVSLEWAITSSIENSAEVVSIFDDDKLLCITGLVHDNGLVPRAYPWLLGTTAMQKYRRQVLLYSKKFILDWRTAYGKLENYVDARHHRAIQWLTHLGAELEFIEKHGIYQTPFYKFTFKELT